MGTMHLAAIVALTLLSSSAFADEGSLQKPTCVPVYTSAMDPNNAAKLAANRQCSAARTAYATLRQCASYEEAMRARPHVAGSPDRVGSIAWQVAQCRRDEAQARSQLAAGMTGPTPEGK